MPFLRSEFEVLERVMPGFAAQVRSRPFDERENEGSDVLSLFKAHGGVDLAIPALHGGKGLSARELVMVQRALGALSPSLAIAINMHQFSVATLVEMAKTTSGVEWMLLQAIAEGRMLVASAFAEGAAGASILEPYLTAESRDGEFVVNGSKKPCSLSRSMELITLSLRVPSPDGPLLAVALVPADTAGIRVRPFWTSPVLRAAESDEVVFDNVVVHEKMISYSGSREELDQVQIAGFVWFELLLTASYLGACSRLLEKLLESPRALGVDITGVAARMECSMNALLQLATEFDVAESDRTSLLGRILLTRYAIQDAIDTSSARAVEALGGMRFLSDPEVPYLLAATKALAFHPPSRTAMQDNLASWLRGGELVLC
ncbi:alkylation response protein AidB-like acyl-CoA dehydrogenase [Tahibacter aquaticus]|uniref:Alkylation response protein AidB-like acyl-CoA dehydrogenase n=1 Tax=Tahibacter aquaticus TaxID=520092 RepID=A0A4R6Z233_9GAMM|nr:acyl-CoA dehydrogenase family protein [Tahibacter aquaticus]TDR45631.1 alkylation response protein AidB-like acyl-CoA dehydrogenase [Tahibacter aquaticus]